jgi:REP element-mobilizing transposase RayT
MENVERIHLPGEVYHLVSRCTRSLWLIQKGDPDRDLFRSALKKSLPGSGVRLLGYAAMSNHIHLVVQAGKKPVGDFMRLFLSTLARGINEATGQVGALVGGRYFSLLVDSDVASPDIGEVLGAERSWGGSRKPAWSGACRRTQQQISKVSPTGRVKASIRVLGGRKYLNQVAKRANAEAVSVGGHMGHLQRFHQPNTMGAMRLLVAVQEAAGLVSWNGGKPGRPSAKLARGHKVALHLLSGWKGICPGEAGPWLGLSPQGARQCAKRKWKSADRALLDQVANSIKTDA